nr:hypothetical protein [uncultured Mediterranean phage uvMED]|tara:strand:+ start:29 stop:508 length:480 start_codon:yes stop_codon:yes gene_type:complete
MITKENLIGAYFIDNDRKNIEALTTSEDGKQVIPTIMPFDENNHSFKELNSIITVDQLHENTHTKKKQEQKIFETKVMEIAKKDGLMVDDTKIDSNSFNKLVTAIFSQGENVDQLFALKLALFELEGIRDSSNNELKKKLRQCSNKIETLKVAFEIIGS